MLNLVIAILATTYEEYIGFKRGLYYDNIVASIPRLKYNKYYGSATCALGPFSVIQFLFSPMYICLKKGTWLLKTINHYLTLMFYIPYGIIITIIFAAVNLLLIPFSYFCAIGSKYKLMRLKLRQGYPMGESVRDLIVFVLVGQLILGV